ncbi:MULTISPECIES: hypothetical protein [unclassified Pedobacter]|uniref:hypothetical protein n=1 Tax=unclassified Pedobacter TaxID=2628915 RepID=UPI00141F49C0|nr:MULTISPECIES: hypothetical protein [unclassified Pedobacter]NII84119.1 hypothetical protein [Pedobacter sp. SG908]NMN38965.1 hypothetical protein [Pedobacter sp. SG918]
MKIFSFFILFFSIIITANAQDFIVKNNDEVIRGTIKGTDYFSVFISANDEADVILPAKDIKNFFWNGDSFVSKGFANGRNFEYRFVKVIEMGTVNLYSFGGGTLVPEVKEKKVKFRPSIGIGTGTGGYGGMGMGGGISIGSGRNTAPERPAGAPVIRYFIEKPGAGPLQEVPMKAITEDTKKAEVKSILLQKMGDQPALKAKVEAGTDFNSRDVIEWVKEYNATKK